MAAYDICCLPHFFCLMARFYCCNTLHREYLLQIRAFHMISDVLLINQNLVLHVPFCRMGNPNQVKQAKVTARLNIPCIAIDCIQKYIQLSKAMYFAHCFGYKEWEGCSKAPKAFSATSRAGWQEKVWLYWSELTPPSKSCSCSWRNSISRNNRIWSHWTSALVKESRLSLWANSLVTAPQDFIRDWTRSGSCGFI